MSFLKANKIFLNEDAESEICKIAEHKIKVYNATALYNTSILYNFPGLSKLSLRLIERCFSKIAGSPKFLELNFKSVAKILSSDELNIDSELQVYFAANDWLSYNVEERSKFAGSLLASIRPTLLSDHALKYLLSEISSTYEAGDCVATINEVLQDNQVTKSRKSFDNFFPGILFISLSFCQTSRHTIGNREIR